MELQGLLIKAAALGVASWQSVRPLALQHACTASSWAGLETQIMVTFLKPRNSQSKPLGVVRPPRAGGGGEGILEGETGLPDTPTLVLLQGLPRGPQR